MALAKDEVVGLVIAALVGAAAITTYVYRESKAAAPEPPAAPTPVDPARARADFAALLAEVFAQDQNPARITADGTTLRIEWEMCSKQMIQRLLHDDKNYQVMNIRDLSGIGVPKLKGLGFTKIECSDGRKGLAPAVHKL